ncbi:ATP-binding cassette domain-containing protein [Micromonospora rosaria]|uniref:ATP-binding cassette domain-containing protein n=1 Tax=Micromonospora rosaria TaxID=47874 RepID=UPI0008299235|nr:ABC transporter ATP-binding protein [Micromonospora rosaria]
MATTDTVLPGDGCAPATPAAGRRLLVGQLRPARADLLRLALGSVLAGAPAFFSGLAVSRAVDAGFLAGDPATGVLWLAGLALLGVAGAYVAQALLPVMARVAEPLRDRLVTLVIGAGLARAVAEETARDGAGAVAVQATEHVEAVRRLVVALLRTTFSTTVTMVLAIAGLATLVPVVTLAVLPFLLLGGALWLAVLRRLIRRQRHLLLAGERLGETSRQVLAAARDVEACGAREQALRPAVAAVEATAAAAAGVNRLGWWRSVVPMLTVQAPVLVLLLLAPWLSRTLGLTSGDLVGAVVYLVHGLAPAVGFMVSGGAGWLVQLGLAGERLAAATSAGPGRAGRAPGGTAPVGPPDLRATGLTFAYSARAAPVLADVALTVPAGTHLAVVGPSGAGKSTLAALLTGLRHPLAGQVTLAGTRLDRWPPDLLRRVVAVVPQESYVFAGTVRENLAYLRPEATTAELADAVRRFGLTPVVARFGGLAGELPPGGGGLSAGERQRIALARTWLSPASVVVLDEATCHLDPVAEEVAEAEMRRRGGTLIVVAHRISSALRADLVTLVADGQVRIGTHDQLLAQHERYADLVGYWQQG